MRALFTVFFMTCAGAMFAQKLHFDYDVGGNLVLRGLLVDVQVNKGLVSAPLDFVSDITVGPNPTEGKFSVSVSNFGMAGEVSVLVFTAQGQLLLRQMMSSPMLDIDISASIAGVYFVNVSVDGTDKSFKILKE